jgi:hypothetical protein
MKDTKDIINATWDFYRVCWIGGFGADQEIDAYIRLRSDFTADTVARILLDMGLFKELPANGDGVIVEATENGFGIHAPLKAWGNTVHPYFSLGRQTEEDLTNADYVNDEYSGAPKAPATKPEETPGCDCGEGCECWKWTNDTSRGQLD